MREYFNNQKFSRFLKILKPWAVGIVLVIVLRYTGALGQIQYATQSALFSTGLMNAPAEVDADAGTFDYDFTLRDTEGRRVDFNEFRGKVVFLNLWATWCGPCRVEMPSIQKLYSSVAGDSIVFVMLSLDRAEDHDKITSYVNRKGFTFPVYTPAGALPAALQVPSIPTTFILGKDGKVKSKHVGTAKYNTKKFREFLRSLAAE